MQPVENISPILLVGLGFFLGTMFSIIVLDFIYKGIMKRTIDEIHRQYSRALELLENKYKRDGENVQEENGD